MRHFIRRFLWSIAAILLPSIASGQEAPGSIVGIARGSTERAALPFALVRLVSATGGAPQQILTDASGRFRFPNVRPGDYRLLLELVGYERTLTAPLTVKAGETATQDILSAFEPIQLNAIEVQAPSTCLTADMLDDVPDIATLWREAQKGLEARRAFDLEYRYARTLKQEGFVRQRLLRDEPLLREETVISEPDSVRARDERRRVSHRDHGYATASAGKFLLRVPNEKDLLDDEFLKLHCIETRVERGAGELALRFRPVRSQSKTVALRGSIWVGANDFLMRRLDLEYLDGEKLLARGTLAYSDVVVDGSNLRFPTSGKVIGWPAGATGLVVTEVEAALTFSYKSFEAPRYGEPVAANPLSRAQRADHARALLRKAVDELGLPGVSAAVGMDREIVWQDGFGWADIEQKLPVTSRTRYRIGSASKPITAAAAGLLYERGQLDLDAPVQQYVPTFPTKRWPVTTRQLLGHVAGIRHYKPLEPLSSKRCTNVLEGLEIFSGDSLLYEPGSRYQYSSHGFILVSSVVQAAAREAFDDFIAREIFSKLGMHDSAPEGLDTASENSAAFYSMGTDTVLRIAPTVDNSCKWAAGGFLSTPADLVRFGMAMQDSTLLKPQTVAMLHTPRTLASGKDTGYGLGWFVTRAPLNGVTEYMVGHGGNSIGGTTSFMMFPAKRLVVAVTTNRTSAEGLAALALKIAEIFADS